jgi:valyl-tRNA synthetase
VRAVIGAIRQLRSDYNVPPGRQLDATVISGNGARRVFVEEAALIGRMARVTLTVAEAAPAGAAATAVLPGGAELVVPLAGMVDLEKEAAKLKAEHANLDKQLTGLRSRLANESFISRAKPEIVEAERLKEREWTARLEQLAAKVRQMGGEA